MSNEGFKPDPAVLAEVAKISSELHFKIATDSDTKPGKRVIGFGFFVYHEDGTIVTDAVGYWDRDRVQARVSNFLMHLAIKHAQQFSDEVFKNEDGTLKTNAEARDKIWEGF